MCAALGLPSGRRNFKRQSTSRFGFTRVQSICGFGSSCRYCSATCQRCRELPHRSSLRSSLILLPLLVSCPTPPPISFLLPSIKPTLSLNSLFSSFLIPNPDNLCFAQKVVPLANMTVQGLIRTAGQVCVACYGLYLALSPACPQFNYCERLTS